MSQALEKALDQGALFKMSEFSDYVVEAPAHKPEQDLDDTSLRLEAAANDKSVTIAKEKLPEVNVDRHQYGNNSRDFVTRYPTGVRVVHQGNTFKVEPPPGGSESPDGKKVYDSKKNVVATVSDDGTVRMKTKYGEFVESKDGQVTFKPNSKAPAGNDLQSLHKAGEIKKDKYEDYGLATDGTSTSFPNGMEWNKKTNNITLPAEYGQFNEKVTRDADGNDVKTATTKDGKLIYKWDSSGLHVPVADGTITQHDDGKVTFEPKGAPATAKKAQKQNSQAGLPDMEIAGL